MNFIAPFKKRNKMVWNPHKFSPGSRALYHTEEEFQDWDETPESQIQDSDDVDLSPELVNDGVGNVDKFIPRFQWFRQNAMQQQQPSDLFHQKNPQFLNNVLEGNGFGSFKNAFRLQQTVGNNASIQQLHSMSSRLRKDNINPLYAGGTGIGVPTRGLNAHPRPVPMHQSFKPTEMIGQNNQLVQKKMIQLPDGCQVETRIPLGIEPEGDYSQQVRSGTHRQKMRVVMAMGGQEHPSEERCPPTDGGRLPPIFDVRGTYPGERYYEPQNQIARFQHNITNQTTRTDVPAFVSSGKGMEGPTQHVQKELTRSQTMSCGPRTNHAKGGWTPGIRMVENKKVPGAMGLSARAMRVRAKTNPTLRHQRPLTTGVRSSGQRFSQATSTPSGKGRGQVMKERALQPNVPATPIRTSLQPASSKSRGTASIMQRNPVVSNVQQVPRNAREDMKASAPRITTERNRRPGIQKIPDVPSRRPQMPSASRVRTSVHARTAFQPFNVPRTQWAVPQPRASAPKQSVHARSSMSAPVTTRPRNAAQDLRTSRSKFRAPARNRDIAYSKVNHPYYRKQPTAHPVNEIEKPVIPPRGNAAGKVNVRNMDVSVPSGVQNSIVENQQLSRPGNPNVNVRYEQASADDQNLRQRDPVGPNVRVLSPLLVKESRFSPPLTEQHAQYTESAEPCYAIE